MLFVLVVREGSRLGGVTLVEDVDAQRSVEILGISPIGDVIAGPFGEVLELPVSDLGV